MSNKLNVKNGLLLVCCLIGALITGCGSRANLQPGEMSMAQWQKERAKEAAHISPQRQAQIHTAAVQEDSIKPESVKKP